MDHPDVLAWRDGHIEALDQTALPHQVRTLRIGTVDELVRAITSLAIRGAPVLGAAGALGVALAVRQGSDEGWNDTRLAAEIARIAAARPTAVNLSREVAAVAARIGDGSAAVEGAALAVLESTGATSLRISARGAEYLLQPCGAGPLRVHTHCNTGALACLGWGTALGVIRALHVAGALSHVIVDETRPLLQGARLTCWELGQLGIEHQLACDGAAPFLISQGRADAVVVGADRIAAEPGAVEEIIRLCGQLPLALAIVSARAAHPGFTLDSIAAELQRTHSRLDALGPAGVACDARTVFSWSYHHLSPQACRLFRLLSLHPASDITAAASASLLGAPPDEANRLMAELTNTSLLTEYRPGRYSFHDLIRAYAAELVGQWAHNHPAARDAITHAAARDPSPSVRKKASWYAPGGTIYERTVPRPAPGPRRRGR